MGTKYKLGWFSTGRDKAAGDLLEVVHNGIERGEILAEIAFVFSTREPGESDESDLFLKLVESYKMNREGKLSPIGLQALRLHCTSSYECVMEDTLEADDLIGIDATGKYKGKNVICSVDKDFLTIPTKVYNPVKNIIKRQTKVDAFKFFIYQVIIGDSSDNYKGIYRVGPKGAKAFLAKHSKNLYNIWEPLVFSVR